MESCDQLLAKWNAEKTSYNGAQETIKKNTAAWAEEQRWYETVSAYNGRLQKASLAPDGITAALDALGTESSALSALAAANFGAMKAYLKQVMHAFNKSHEAIELMAPVKAHADALSADDSTLFKDSEIKKTLDAVFNSHLEIRAKAEATLTQALDPVRLTLSLKNALGKDGVAAQAATIKNLAAKCKAQTVSSAHYKDMTGEEWEKAQTAKNAQDAVRAQAALSSALEVAYETAMKALNCPVPATP